jgi:cytochrome P450
LLLWQQAVCLDAKPTPAASGIANTLIHTNNRPAFRFIQASNLAYSRIISIRSIYPCRFIVQQEVIMLESSASFSGTQFSARKSEIPQTAGLPLVGSLPKMLKDPFQFVVDSRNELGDVYWLNLGLTKVVMLNNPRHAQHVLRDNARNYRKGGPMWDAVRGLLGNGLVVSEGDFWLRQRRMMQPHFHRKRLAGLTELMVSAIQEALDLWQERADAGQTFDLAQGFNKVTMKVIVRTLFGSGLSREEMEEVGTAMTFVLDYLMSAIITDNLPSWLPIPGRKKYNEAMAKIDEILYRIIAQVRAGNEGDNHLLAMLLNTVDEETGEAMSDQQLRDEVATLFLAGYETTSLALTWAFDYMNQNPEVIKKLQAEVDEVLDGRTPEFTDIPQLTYARMIFEETMRLRPPSYWLPRVVEEDDEIDGYQIPAGTNVVSLTYMYHRHPKHWDDAETFDPERFSKENSAGRNAFAFIPFGAGQRKCIGMDFAMMEGPLVLAMVAQRFNIDTIAGQLAKPMLSSTLRPKGGLPVHLQNR